MYYVIHCGGLPFNGDTIKTQSLGGSESAAYYMAKELAEKGHNVTVFTNSKDEGKFDGVKYCWAGQVTEHNPLGEAFHFYAQNTPHDVLIIQRHPYAFNFAYAAKIKLWWMHDLAMVRHREIIQQGLWNCDGILTVSGYHKKQVCETWGINPEKVFAIQNGVDLSLFEGDISSHFGNIGEGRKSLNQKALLYTSRPERGLEWLVMPDGIMDRLGSMDKNYHLYVCGYDNTTAHMKDYYEYLWGRCEELENVTLLGHLTKQELADVMRQSDLHVYPVPGPEQPNFEEVSCITAMEDMAAGLPLLSSNHGALPETCEGSGALLLPLNDKGFPDIQKFVDAISGGIIGPEAVTRQLESAPKFAWSVAAGMVENIVKGQFSTYSDNAKMRDMIRKSDIYAVRDFEELPDPITQGCRAELDECYGFAWNNTWGDHYQRYYEYEKDRGVEYGPERMDGNPRFEYVSGFIDNLPDNVRVLDYGCAHGHYTVTMAGRFPDNQFVGIDITESNIEKARAWADSEGLTNIEFLHGWIDDAGVLQIPERESVVMASGATGGGVEEQHEALGAFDVILAAEVIEHVGAPQHLVDNLCTYLTDNGVFMGTVPYGPWEAMGYEEHWPWRAHVYHFERQDIMDMFGVHKNLNIVCAPSGNSKWGQAKGSHIFTFGKPEQLSGPIDLDRKYRELAPLQTVSSCLIVKDGGETLLKTLNSISGVSDEILIGVDESTTDNTLNVIAHFIEARKGLWPRVEWFNIKPAIETGFDEARNSVIEKASGDWVLWLDSDETLVHPENIFKYLHDNAYDGYAMKQHHFSIEPLGVMKTDLPVRLFRNHKGIKFFGVVHEHPEKALNEGVGHAMMIPDLDIEHVGYQTEHVRKGRFNRNIELLVRDREKYPDRKLGKFLWIRDLAQMIKFELDNNGQQMTPGIYQKATYVVDGWLELLNMAEFRMALDSLMYYSAAAKILDDGKGFDYGIAVDAKKAGDVDPRKQGPIMAHFANREHLDKFTKLLTDEKVKDYDSRYF